MDNIMKPGVAGQFYPANAKVLKNNIEAYLKKAKSDKIYENIFGLIVPHAGYLFSGSTAAHAYNFIKEKKYDTVFVIAPSHSYISSPIGIYDYEFYKTPLGLIPIEQEIIDLLFQEEDIGDIKFGMRPENSLETQLPFLQSVLEEFQLVPILIRDQSLPTAKKLAKIIKNVLSDYEKNVLFIFSTDLSHFHSAKTAEKLDHRLIESVGKMDLNKFDQLIQTGDGEACGFGCVETGLVLAEKYGIKNIDILEYTHSGKISGDNTRVVGYMSALLYK